MNGLVVSAVAPHGGIAVAELCDEAQLDVALATRRGLEELGRRFAAAAPETLVVVTPHNVHVEGSLAVIVAGRLEGSVTDGGREIALTSPADVDFSMALLDGLEGAGIPAAAVSYGGNAPAESSMPMDWGALIPLWYLGGRADPPPSVTLVSPARDLLAEVHVRAGRTIAEVATASGKRVGLIASADHGHAHDPNGPYGFDPASAAYDERIVEIVGQNRLAELLDLEPAFVAAAKADSWWQLLVLHGATEGAFEVELLSYEAPTYFGMLCAAFTPRAS